MATAVVSAGAGERRAILGLMMRVRAFEDRLTARARADAVPGMQILATGQEAVVAAVRVLRADDVVVSNHRSHAHLLARDSDPSALMAEILGKTNGVNRGKSGTLHLIDPDVNALMTSTVVGAGPPMAAGAAFAQRYRGDDAITAVFFGDGAAAEGSVHEAMNLAGAWSLPVLFVCENNQWAGAQALDVHCAGGSVVARARGYGMPGERVDGNDADAVHAAAARLAAGVRGGGPALLELHTYRMHGHGESDPQHYVDPDELDAWRRRDPIARYAERLREEGVVTAADVDALQAEADEVADVAVAFADASPPADPGEAVAHIRAPASPATDRSARPGADGADASRTLYGGQAVNEALTVAMASDERVFLAGEGVGVSIHPGPMGATHGLLERFGERRVRDTPVSEAAIAGLAVGAATLGLRPVVEVMFFPFLTLASDMLVNHAAKLRYLSAGRTPVPLTVRLKAGLGTAGCQHSHNLEAWLAHSPGIKVVWGSNPADMKGLLLSAIFDPDPVVVVEDMALYRAQGPTPEGDARVPLGRAAVARAGADITVAAYGAAVGTALQAADTLAGEGVSVEVLDLRTLVPLDRDAILESVRRTGRFIALHDATRFAGFGAELAAMVAEEAFDGLQAPVRRVAAPDAPVPFAPSQVAAYRPDADDLVAAVRSVLG
ncbi:MAG: thiamine pyrophosphate-dependent enzyme [Longimicrobiales bacterium]